LVSQVWRLSFSPMARCTRTVPRSGAQNNKNAHWHDEGSHVFQLSGEGGLLPLREPGRGAAPDRLDLRDPALAATGHVAPALQRVGTSGALPRDRDRQHAAPVPAQEDADGAARLLKKNDVQIEYEDKSPEIRRTFEAECTTYRTRRQKQLATTP
jgi:hypothetical protein